MKENEAIKILQRDLQIQLENKALPDGIEAIQIAIQALEKQIPNKPIFNYNRSDTLFVFHCECGNIIKVSHGIGIMDNNNAPNYCSKCGCRLDWSDEN